MKQEDKTRSESKSPRPGCLYVVATPIGNLEDITLRAIRILGEVDLIAAEDTRHTRRLLAAHDIRNQLVSFHEHNETRRTPELLQRMRQGQQVALVSDAGTPMVSDPGYKLVRAAVEDHIQVVPVPGVSAVMAALGASGLATDQFAFIGFPARKKSRRLEQLTRAAGFSGTLVFYQSPRRLMDFLDELQAVLGDRQAVLARELTKIHEEFIRGPISAIKGELARREAVRGECTLLVEGTGREERPIAEADWEQHLQAALERQDSSVGEIAKEIAGRFGLKKREVYNKALQIKKSGPA